MVKPKCNNCGTENSKIVKSNQGEIAWFYLLDYSKLILNKYGETEYMFLCVLEEDVKNANFNGKERLLCTDCGYKKLERDEVFGMKVDKN